MRITYSQSQITSWLASGNRLLPGEYTYSVPGQSSIWPGYSNRDEIGEPGYALPDAAMGSAFIRAIELWDELVAPNFVQVSDNAFSRGQLRVAVTSMDDDSSAYAYYPSGFSEKRADVWFNEQYGPWNFSDGQFDFYAMLHEVAHALGLKHSFEGQSVPEALESRRFSTLSYTAPDERYVYFRQESDGFYSYTTSVNPITPMVLDIAAVQAIYGEDLTTRAGDTVYRFEEFGPGLQAIYDAGGNDTIDLSGFTLGNTVDLRPGAYSSIGTASAAQQIAHWASLFPQHRDFIAEQINKRADLYTFSDNLGIAINTWIENARAGSGDDVLTGNERDNVLDGGAGDDLIVGLSGSDTLFGGAGNDILHGDAAISLPLAGSSENISSQSGDGNDGISGAGAAIVSPPGIMLSVGLPSKPGNAALDLHDHGLLIPEQVRIAAGPLDTPFAGLNISNSRVPKPEPDPEPEVQPEPESEDGEEAEADLATVFASFDGISDSLSGGAGDDILHGGAGRDDLTGGSGADRFLFADGDFAGLTGTDADRILDFSAAQGDVIDLSLVDAVSGGEDDAFAFIGFDAFSRTAGELRIDVKADYALISGDIDGDGLGDFAIRLDGVDVIAANSFVL